MPRVFHVRLPGVPLADLHTRGEDATGLVKVSGAPSEREVAQRPRIWSMVQSLHSMGAGSFSYKDRGTN